MIGYQQWKKLNESIGDSFIGIGSPGTVGVINGLGNYAAPLNTEAGKQPVMDDMDDMDGDEDMDDMDGDEDADDGFDEKPKAKKSKKSKCKCNCGCPKCDSADEDMPKEESSTLFNYFCTCRDANLSNGVCGKCSKFVMESANYEFIINESLNWYRGAESNLYKLASYVINKYAPSQDICEGAKQEIVKIFNEQNDASKLVLARLYHSIHQMGV